jgi:hypothetical protein
MMLAAHIYAMTIAAVIGANQSQPIERHATCWAEIVRAVAADLCKMRSGCASPATYMGGRLQRACKLIMNSKPPFKVTMHAGSADVVPRSFPEDKDSFAVGVAWREAGIIFYVTGWLDGERCAQVQVQKYLQPGPKNLQKRPLRVTEAHECNEFP